MLVSIITPTFNHENYIADCIESVIGQIYTDWELIIIDDGSMDNTAKIAKKYADIDGRIRYFHQQNVGLENLSLTYNKALSYSNGELIAILEGDDYWYPEKLALQVNVFKSNPEVIFCWGKVDQVFGNKIKFGQYPQNTSSSQFPFYNNEKPGAILNVIFDEFPIPLTWVIRKSELAKIGGFLQSKEIPTVDRDTLYALSLNGKFNYIGETIGAYRRPIEQATKRMTVQIAWGCCFVIKDFYNKLSPEIRSNILFDQDYIDKRCKQMMVIAYSKYGRSCLVRKEFLEARKSYLKSLEGNIFFLPIWKIRSIVGLIFSFLHLDLEGMVRLLGKKSYKR